MDWGNERFVRSYTRDTEDDLLLSYEAFALWCVLLRKLDRAGVLEAKRGAKSVALVVRWPIEVVERVLPEILADGRLVEHDLGYAAPNFLEAQETPQSDKQRAKESRARRADRSRRITPSHAESRAVTNRDGADTNRDSSVTPCHAPSRAVTPCHSEPSEPSGQEDSPAGARAIPPAPSTARGAGTGPQEQHPEALRGRQSLRDRAWARLHEIRERIAAEKGWDDVQPLHTFDPGKAELAARILEAGDAAEAQVTHVIAMLEAEARAKGTVQWLTGSAFSSTSWRRLLGMRAEDAVTSSAIPARAGPNRGRAALDDDRTRIRKIRDL